MKVLVLHTLPPKSPGSLPSLAGFDLQPCAQGVADVLTNAVVAGVRGEPGEIMSLLAQERPEVVFNLCESPLGRSDLEPHPVALLEWLGVRFTGSGSSTLALCRRKDRTNAVLAEAGVPIPRKNVYPCIVKPADQDASVGVHAESKCDDEAAVTRALARLSGRAIIEEFLPGREFSVSLWGCDTPTYTSIGETQFQNEQLLITYASKWDEKSQEFRNTPVVYDINLDEPLRQTILATARDAWTAVEARGYMRVDIRLDAEGAPRVLDVNPNPDLTPGAGICRAVVEQGWSLERFVRQQIEWA